MSPKKGTALESSRRPRIVYVLLVLLAAFALFAAACGGGDDGDDGNGEGGGTSEPAGGGDGGGSTATLSVDAVDFGFEPADLDVEPGAEVTVTFSNTGEAPHTMTADTVGLNIEADPGATAEGTFTAPDSGSIDFQCTIHPDMQGTISVGGAADAGGSDKKDDGGSDDSGYDY
jgi:plastocyanin